ncbi:peroxisomal membrane protein pex16 [Eremomyces bilateralis CBS 781.70]|uniref:Peroxisomal membrane protein PEX16 n=1 Tax=Eremomyces bilateralis CBS 781.70 TaxID=1392243 RepID=A0A6G1G9I2_9PEZI|nr:peroxisomal membrane protein pex16 [Eremomyces bilateralis CBS 781.70]KAF1814561.1 peroxisomal membrane protein pex16 [Eremomyces bilateralis CBS 781.70]
MDAHKFASKGVPEALSLPPKWLGMYSDFILKNASAVSQIESALRSLTYIIPGRFRESEIASESLHSGVQLLSLYHDSLLSKAISRLPLPQRPHPSPHNRYTKFWSQRSPFYRRLALTLQMIQYTELLWEMAAKRKGEKVRWRVVVFLEAIKALCRLLLLRLTNSRPLLSPPLPEREVDPATVEESARAASAEERGEPLIPPPDLNDGSQTPPSERSEAPSDAGWTMPRTGLSMPSLPDTSDISSYLLSKVLTADDIKPPKALLHRVSGKGEIAEILYILRPVVYAFAMQRWGRDKKNWTPWLLGLSIEYGARQLAKNDFQERLAGGLRGLTVLEREELRKRGWNLGWWMMRGAFYENITKGWIHTVSQKLQNKPLLGLVGGIIEDYEFLWDQHYFPTATL